MMLLLGIEVRRCAARRLVRALVGLALVGCALCLLLSYRAAAHDAARLPFQLAELHQPESGESVLGAAAFFLIIGAAVGGASMIGAEWRAGTFTTLLTWAPQRRRVAVAKLAACGLVAAAVAMVLEALFIASLVPAALGPGTTEGVDADWVWSLTGAGVRVAAITALVAVFMASVAMIGRSTAAALGFAFAYLLLVENLVRAWKPWSGRYLLGENGARFITGAELEGLPFETSTVAAGITLGAYAALAVALAVATFWRRDLAAAP
ncbi:MAG TPA: ABC transporter permease [Ornithinibacter sp.]|nr:ABC transporter permease [Ornithinibacter sp.]